MDGSQFDAWTRRGFGAAAGGLAGSLLALAALPVAAAKKKGKRGKKKRKRCTKLGDACNDGKKTCCCGLACREPVNGLETGRKCCKIGGSPCTFGENECCSGDCGGDFCACKTTGDTCGDDHECCSFRCNNTCLPPF